MTERRKTTEEEEKGGGGNGKERQERKQKGSDPFVSVSPSFVFLVFGEQPGPFNEGATE
jgi:hypothetical protein